MKQRKSTRLIYMISMALISLVVLIPSMTPGGNLDPTAAPASTMKTLDEVEPRIAIPGSSTATTAYTISQSGSYYLAGNRVCSGAGIVVATSNVTIDLMGYSLFGPGTGTDNGIYMNGYNNVEIKNGTVRGFYNGIYEGSTSGKGHRVIKVRAIANLASGIELKSTDNLVMDCTVRETGVSSSATVTGIFVGKGSAVVNNVVNDNGAYSSGESITGIYLSNGCTAADNTVYRNGYSVTKPVFGIHSQTSTRVTGNTVFDNGNSATGSVSGIYLFGNSLVDQNMVYENGTNINTCPTCTFGTNYAP